MSSTPSGSRSESSIPDLAGGPVGLVDAAGEAEVRAAEAVDPEGRQWPRTKRSDDATAVYLALDGPASL